MTAATISRSDNRNRLTRDCLAWAPRSGADSRTGWCSPTLEKKSARLTDTGRGRHFHKLDDERAEFYLALPTPLFDVARVESPHLQLSEREVDAGHNTGLTRPIMRRDSCPTDPGLCVAYQVRVPFCMARSGAEDPSFGVEDHRLEYVVLSMPARWPG